MARVRRRAGGRGPPATRTIAWTRRAPPGDARGDVGDDRPQAPARSSKREPAAAIGPRIDVAGVGLTTSAHRRRERRRRHEDPAAQPRRGQRRQRGRRLGPSRRRSRGCSAGGSWACASAALVGDLARCAHRAAGRTTPSGPPSEDASGEGEALRGVLDRAFGTGQVSNDPAEEERLVATGLSPRQAPESGTIWRTDRATAQRADREGRVGQPDAGPQAVRHRGAHGVRPASRAAGCRRRPAQGHLELPDARNRRRPPPGSAASAGTSSIGPSHTRRGRPAVDERRAASRR